MRDGKVHTPVEYREELTEAINAPGKGHMEDSLVDEVAAGKDIGVSLCGIVPFGELEGDLVGFIVDEDVRKGQFDEFFVPGLFLSELSETLLFYVIYLHRLKGFGVEIVVVSVVIIFIALMMILHAILISISIAFSPPLFS